MDFSQVVIRDEEARCGIGVARVGRRSSRKQFSSSRQVGGAARQIAGFRLHLAQVEVSAAELYARELIGPRLEHLAAQAHGFLTAAKGAWNVANAAASDIRLNIAHTLVRRGEFVLERYI